MLNSLNSIIIILIVIFCFDGKLYASGWRYVNLDGAISEVKAIAIDKDNNDIIYVGSKQALYKTVDAGKNWQLSGEGLVGRINYLLIDKQDSRNIYAATEKGLFRSQDSGGSWERIFRGNGELEQDVLYAALCVSSPKTIFIATKAGIFFSPVSRIIWQKVSGKLNDSSVISIAVDEKDDDVFYVVSNRGLFKTQDRAFSYEKLYESSNLDSEDSSSESDVDTDEDSGEEINSGEFFLRYLAIDPEDNKQIYLATSRGLLFSQDSGKSWKRLALSGSLDDRINYVLIQNTNIKRFFLATSKGVFDCDNGLCKHLYKGADFKDCNQLALTSENSLYAATNRGLFLMPLGESLKLEKAALYIDNKNSKDEPTIQEIQREAIKYAEVNPEKIINWRKQARLKALMPQFTLDYDKTVTTALGATYDRFSVGPRDWGMSLEWDLADIIFSSDQTSIDVRSRLMVQLRDDILNEVTRLYFERKRLKAELLLAEEMEDRVRLEKELRLQELTAFIDGLTGGYFSRALGVMQE